MFDNGKEEVAYLADIDGKIPSDAVSGNIATFGTGGVLVDSGKKPTDFATPSAVGDAVSGAFSEAWDAMSGEYAVAAYKAPAWEAHGIYSDGDFCKYNGEGYICTQGHTAGESFSDDSNKWKKVLTFAGVSALDAMLSAVVSGGASLNDLAPDFSSSSVYSANQLVKKGGKIQICTVAGTGDGATFADATVEQAIQARYDALIDIIPSPSEVPVVDETLSIPGAAADAKVVGERLAAKVSIDSLPYKIKILGGTTYSDPSDSSSPDDSSSAAPIYDPNDPTRVRFELEDRTINVVDMTMSGNLDTIVLTPPAIPGPNLSRDFYVVFRVTSPMKVDVDMESASLIDFAGFPVTLSAPSGTTTTYRFSEVSRLGYVFLATCYADPAYAMVKEIDRALDDILEGLGETPDFEKGVYIPDENDSNKLYKIVAVNSDGEVNIGIDQTPVEL